MPRGPLPDPNSRRRNAPTIPTTKLPAGGRPGPVPRPPKGANLGDAGKAWWRWAWRTPQAAAWSTGDHVAIARRAQLEDDLQALEFIGLDLDRLPAESDDELAAYLDHLKYVIEKLKSLAGGKLAIAREMRELDDRFGLTPKARAALRWEVVQDQADDGPADADDEVAARREERKKRLAAGG